MSSSSFSKLIIISLILAPFFSGCLSDDSSDNELVIVTYDVNALSDSMISNFENNTGLEVKIIKVGDAGSILSYLIQNEDTGIVDLAIGLDNTYLPTAIDLGLLSEVPVNLDKLSHESSFQQMKALNPYNGTLATPFDMGYICLNYDSSIVDGENLKVPTSLWNLTEPDWKGKVAIPSPITSSPGRGFMLATLDYFDWQDNDQDFGNWWTAMRDNDVIITSGWSEAYETHYTGGYGEYTEGYIGDAHITVSYCHSPGVEAWYNGNWTKSASLDLDKTAFFQVEYASAVKGGNQKNTEEFIQYLISSEVNSQMPTENLMYSVLEGENLPEENGYRFHSLIPSDPANISNQAINENMESWLEKWNTAMTKSE
tara:strand:- start:2288 stop:3397 length:1110 start_codon:yes stop_codon:yes gene_type:complete